MEPIEFLKRLYALFNARDMERLLAGMHHDVVWANGMEGGHVHGHNGVRDYWTRQWAIIDPHVDPIDIQQRPTGEFDVRVRAVVRDLTGTLLSDQLVNHVFMVENGLVRRFDIQE